MMSREKDMRQQLFQYGVALAISLGGIVHSFLRSRTIETSESPPSTQPCSDFGNQISSSGDIKDDHELLTKGGSLNSSSIGQHNYEELSQPKKPNESFTNHFSSSFKVNRDKDCNFSAKITGLSSKMDTAPVDSDEENFIDYRCVKKGVSGDGQELKTLRNMVAFLNEREKRLEFQLLEYYGLKEQETVVIELQNRLKLNNMETELLNLKIESLLTDKRRLEEQVSDQAKLAEELAAAKSKIKLLQKILKSEAEHNKENIMSLQQRVTKLQEEENKTSAEVKLERLKDLEEEAEELRKEISTLRLENSDLARTLERAQLIATSVMNDEETTMLKKECHHLRKENEELKEKVELLQADGCSDAEEMVYLRWINACMHYELRNYQPSPGRTIARELSKTLSPRSEEIAKQLLQYGSAEGMADKGRNLIQYDSDRLKSSRNSDATDSGDYSSTDIKLPTKIKSKGFGKLKRLLLGKDNNNHRRVPSGETCAYIADMVVKCQGDSGVSTVTGTDGTNKRSTSRGSKYSLDLQRTSDEGSLPIFSSIDPIADNATISMQPNKLDHISENMRKPELAKYAEALKVSRNKPSKRRSTSTSF